MKPLLFVLLAASLVANVVLGLRARRPVSPSAAATATPASTSGSESTATAAPTRSPGETPSGSLAPTGMAWRATASEQELRQVVVSLRAAGFPPAIVRAIFHELLNQLFASRQPNAGTPYWQQHAPTPETLAAQAALKKERLALFEALLGPDAHPSAMLDTASRLRRYGNLPDDRIDAVAKIEQDYNEMTAESWAKRRGNLATNMDTLLQSQQLIEQEKLADIAAVLTPEQLAEYELRNSASARTLINNLRNVEVSEPEYTKLYEMQKSFDAAHPMRATMDQAYYAQRQAAQLALNDQARAVLGEERFYSYLEGADHFYANVAKILNRQPTVTPASAYQVYQLQVELQNRLAQITRAGPMNKENSGDMRGVIQAYNTKLEGLIGAESAAVYRNQGIGRIFSPAP